MEQAHGPCIMGLVVYMGFADLRPIWIPYLFLITFLNKLRKIFIIIIIKYSNII